MITSFLNVTYWNHCHWFCEFRFFKWSSISVSWISCYYMQFLNKAQPKSTAKLLQSSPKSILKEIVLKWCPITFTSELYLCSCRDNKKIATNSLQYLKPIGDNYSGWANIISFAKYPEKIVDEMIQFDEMIKFTQEPCIKDL